MEVRETFGETETDVNQSLNYVNNSHLGCFVSLDIGTNLLAYRDCASLGAESCYFIP